MASDSADSDDEDSDEDDVDDDDDDGSGEETNRCPHKISNSTTDGIW